MASSENVDSLAEARNVPLPEPTPEEERRLLNVDEDIVMVDPVPHNSGEEQPPNREQASETHRDEEEAREPMMSRDEMLRELRRVTDELRRREARDEARGRAGTIRRRSTFSQRLREQNRGSKYVSAYIEINWNDK